AGSAAGSVSSSPKVAPRVRGHWLLGCLRQLQKDPLNFYSRLRREHGDYVHIRVLPGIPLYLLTHPDAVEHVLQKNHKNPPKPASLLGDDRTPGMQRPVNQQCRVVAPPAAAHAARLPPPAPGPARPADGRRRRGLRPPARGREPGAAGGYPRRDDAAGPAR